VVDAGERPIFLVGFMGSGKTEVGTRLAMRLGRSFADTDRFVEERTGLSVERMFAEWGEGRFREREAEALATLRTLRRAVIATGGGLYTCRAHRDAIRASGVSVWLDVSLEGVKRRLGESAGRPLWRTHDRVALRAFFERRRATYALADLRVDAESGDVEEVVARVLAALFR
jgi:shikimate kinase